MIGQDESEGSPAQQAADVSARPFGGIQLFVGGVRVAPVESSRVRSLVAFLILHRDAPHSRQRLAFMLWPDSAEAQPRTNLRHLIHTLRQAMPELDRFLDITSTSVAWREDTMTWFDVSAFEVAQRGSDSPGISVPEEVVFLRQAIDLYRGDLLDGLYDDWVLDLREQFRDRYLMQLRRLAAALDAAGDHPEAVRLGRELLRCDPLREETYRFLMTALATSGDRSGAARVYHECVATLRRELRVEPSPAPNFFRRPFGPGWALVGDAGYTRDPITAQGMTDAFRDAELCAGAVHQGLVGERPFGDAMADYQCARDTKVLPIYEFTTQLAALEPPPAELQQVLAAVYGNQSAMDDFASITAGTVSPVDFFAPSNIGRIMSEAAAPHGRNTIEDDVVLAPSSA